ncbi:hypothetical protein [Burkholderia cenocepacia]|uniref:hypothetical protein n=1 Tax=Burkholderia cenocepacia TaxID=95486 RepID=UPI00098107B0|nr:hypothetical protein [Burkholderia cenocepacia]
MSSNSYVNLKIATCLVRYADDRLIDQRFPILTLRADPLETALGGSPPRREHYVAHDVIPKMEVVDFDPNLAII